MKLVLKVFVPLFLFIVGIPVALYVLGSRAPGLATVEARVSIARPASSVYPCLLDRKELKLWVTGLDEVTELDEAGLRPGAKRLFVYVEPRRRTAIRWEIVDLVPNARVRLRGTNSSVDVEAAWELRETGGGTAVSFRATHRYKTAFSKLFARRLARAEAERMEESLARLRQMLERRAERA